MFVYCFSSLKRIFLSYGHVTITGEGLQIVPTLTLIATEQLGFFSVSQLLREGHLRGLDIQPVTECLQWNTLTTCLTTVALGIQTLTTYQLLYLAAICNI